MLLEFLYLDRGNAIGLDGVYGDLAISPSGATLKNRVPSEKRRTHRVVTNQHLPAEIHPPRGHRQGAGDHRRANGRGFRRRTASHPGIDSLQFRESIAMGFLVLRKPSRSCLPTRLAIVQ